MAIKDRKNRRLRGSKHCGWGIQKHRGKGNQGGAGHSGWYKQKWCKYSKYFKDMHGSYGFTRHSADSEIRAINIGDIEKNLKNFVDEGKVIVKNDVYYLNLKSIGFDKLLGNGKISHKFVVVNANLLSEKAKEKIEGAGGTIKTEAEENENTDGDKGDVSESDKK